MYKIASRYDAEINTTSLAAEWKEWHALKQNDDS